MIETIRNKGRENYQIMSNYRYFGNCVKKETQNLNQTRIKASLSFDALNLGKIFIFNFSSQKGFITLILGRKEFVDDNHEEHFRRSYFQF